MGAIQVLPVEAVVDLLENPRLQPREVLLHLSGCPYGRNNLLANWFQKVLWGFCQNLSRAAFRLWHPKNCLSNTASDFDSEHKNTSFKAVEKLILRS